MVVIEVKHTVDEGQNRIEKGFTTVAQMRTLFLMSFSVVG